MTTQPSRTWSPLALIALAIAALFLAGSVATVQAKPKQNKKPSVTKGPAGLKFYSPPKKTPKAHGKLIWARKAGGVVPLSSASSTQNVLYTSKSPLGKRVVVSGSVSIPKGKAPAGGWPVISYAHGTTGIADKCAPSRNRANGPATPYISYTDGILNSWLKAGYAIARTDYQGLGTPGVHPFLIGKAEGRSVLDIVSAARDLSPKISKRYLIAGHSQGGHAALFAAGESSTYSPSLKLRGTLAYAPASHLRLQASLLPSLTTPSSLTALASLIVRGALAVDSSINPDALLSDPVLAFYPQTDSECLSRLAESDNLGGIAPSELIRDGADTSGLFDLLDKQNPAVKTSQPILLAQGTNDTTTFPFLTDSLNGELVALGDSVDYRKYEGADHGGVIDAAAADSITFFESRLPGGR